MKPKSYFHKTTFPDIILMNVFFEREQYTNEILTVSSCLERMTDIYQLLILRLVIGKASSFIASVMGFIVHSFIILLSLLL